MKKLFLIALLFGAVSFAFAQDTDNDGTPDANDCAPTDPSKWASAIYIDQDGDGVYMQLTGCFGGDLPSWTAFNYGYLYTVYYFYDGSFGESLDDCDLDPNCQGSGEPVSVASADTDNDGEPDFTDPNPFNAAVNHMTIDFCNGLDDNSNGLIDEDCVPCSVNAGQNEQLYFGYAPQQCVTKTASVTSGATPYVYSWVLSRALLTGETMTGANTSSVSVCLMDTAEICVTVTDAENCTVTDCAMIFAEDVRCGNNSNKVLLCHNSNSICADQNAVAAHVAHGDYMGSCTQQRYAMDNVSEKNGLVALFPNPASEKFTLKFVSISSENYSLTISDITGRIIFNENGKTVPGINEYVVNVSLLSAGTYIISLKTENQNRFIKTIVE